MLNDNAIKTKISEMQKAMNLDYYSFLMNIFVKENALTWNQVIDMLVPRIPKKKKEKEHHQIYNISTLAMQLYIQNQGLPYSR